MANYVVIITSVITTVVVVCYVLYFMLNLHFYNDDGRKLGDQVGDGIF